MAVADGGRVTIAHTLTGRRYPDFDFVHVWRTHHRASVRAALRKAGQIRRAGYLVWIERTGVMATR